jgi:hypothetical protein
MAGLPRDGGGAMTVHPEFHEVVPKALRKRLRWDERHDQVAEEVMAEFGLKLPEHRELIRQLSFTRVAFGPLRLDDPEA